MDPQKPLEEQQFPKELPAQVKPDEPPHVPSVEITARVTSAVAVSSVGRLRARLDKSPRIAVVVRSMLKLR